MTSHDYFEQRKWTGEWWDDWYDKSLCFELLTAMRKSSSGSLEKQTIRKKCNKCFSVLLYCYEYQNWVAGPVSNCKCCSHKANSLRWCKVFGRTALLRLASMAQSWTFEIGWEAWMGPGRARSMTHWGLESDFLVEVGRQGENFEAFWSSSGCPTMGGSNSKILQFLKCYLHSTKKPFAVF